jgi:hypothetical protein
MIEIIIPSIIINNIPLIFLVSSVVGFLILGVIVFVYTGDPGILLIGIIFLVMALLLATTKDGSPIQFIKIMVET